MSGRVEGSEQVPPHCHCSLARFTRQAQWSHSVRPGAQQTSVSAASAAVCSAVLCCVVALSSSQRLNVS